MLFIVILSILNNPQSIHQAMYIIYYICTMFQSWPNTFWEIV